MQTISLAHRLFRQLPRQSHRDSARSKFVQRAETMLRRADQPRFQMSLIMAATGGVGFAVSSGLLHAGVDQMAIRYPLAVAVAYVAFLGFLRLWMRYQGVRLAKGIDLADLPDISIGAKGSSSVPEIFKGGGGRFGGGGATAFFDGPAASPAPALSGSVSTSANTGSKIGRGFLDIDFDDLGLVLIALAMAACATLAGLYIIYIAPGLFAEILVDGAVMAGLYKHLKKQDSQHWLTTAVKRTWLPASGLAIVFAIGGLLIQKYAPQVHSLGALLR